MAVAERELAAAPQENASECWPQPFRWTREQFYRAGDAGLFEGQHVELIAGEIILMPPIGPAHQGINTIVADALQAAFGGGFFVRE